MGIDVSNYNSRSIRKEDIEEVIKILMAGIPIRDKRELVNDIMDSTRVPSVLCHIMRRTSTNEIVGVACLHVFDSNISISYFYLDETVRRTKIAYLFFHSCILPYIGSKPMLLRGLDISMYKNHIQHVEGDVFQYVGNCDE